MINDAKLEPGLTPEASSVFAATFQGTVEWASFRAADEMRRLVGGRWLRASRATPSPAGVASHAPEYCMRYSILEILHRWIDWGFEFCPSNSLNDFARGRRCCLS
jgi:hypothetical protein